MPVHRSSRASNTLARAPRLRHSTTSPVRFRRQWLALRSLTCLVFALGALLGLFGMASLSVPVAQAASQRSASHLSGNGPAINWDSSMIYSGQNNGNPEGPVGEQSKVNGVGFTPGATVNVVLAPGDSNADASVCQSSGDVTIANDVVIQSDGTFALGFTWPSDASSGQYSVCALDPSNGSVVSNQDSGPFSVLSASPPAIQLSSTQLNPGGSVTITGSNFVPTQTVNVLIATCHNCGATPLVMTTTNSDASGNFSVTLNLPSNTSPGTYVATAFTQNGVLDVGLIGGAVSLTVNAPATATPNPTTPATNTPQAATATTQPTTATGGGSTTGTNTTGTNTGGSDTTPYVIGIVVAVVVLLIALAAGLYMLIRRRGAVGPTGARRAPPPAVEGGSGGYGAYANYGNYGAPVSTPSGSYTPPGGYTPITGTGTTGANTPPDWRVLPTWDGSQTAGLPGAGVTPTTPASPAAPPVAPNFGDDAPTIPGSY